MEGPTITTPIKSKELLYQEAIENAEKIYQEGISMAKKKYDASIEFYTTQRACMLKNADKILTKKSLLTPEEKKALKEEEEKKKQLEKEKEKEEKQKKQVEDMKSELLTLGWTPVEQKRRMKLKEMLIKLGGSLEDLKPKPVSIPKAIPLTEEKKQEIFTTGDDIFNNYMSKCLVLIDVPDLPIFQAALFTLLDSSYTSLYKDHIDIDEIQYLSIEQYNTLVKKINPEQSPLTQTHKEEEVEEESDFDEKELEEARKRLKEQYSKPIEKKEQVAPPTPVKPSPSVTPLPPLPPLTLPSAQVKHVSFDFQTAEEKELEELRNAHKTKQEIPTLPPAAKKPMKKAFCRQSDKEIGPGVVLYPKPVVDVF
jgi:hypothetical protein